MAGATEELPELIGSRLKGTASLSITEMFNEGYSAAQDQELWPWAEISEILDDRICPLCGEVDGMIVRVGSPEHVRWRSASHIG